MKIKKSVAIILAINIIVNMLFNIQVYASTSENNMIENGDFESGFDGWEMNWFVFGTDFDSSYEIKEDLFSKYLNLRFERVGYEKTSVNPYPCITNSFDVELNKEYRLTFDYRVNEINNQSGTRGAMVRFGSYLYDWSSSAHVSEEIHEGVDLYEWKTLELSTTFTQSSYDGKALSPYILLGTNIMDEVGDVLDIDIRNVKVIDVEEEQARLNLSIPSITNVTESEDSISVEWAYTANDIMYELEVDGTVLDMKYDRKHVLKDLDPNTFHLFRVRSYNGTLRSDWSEYYESWTDISDPVLPEEIKVRANSDNILFHWENDPNIEYYLITFDGFEFPMIRENYFQIGGLAPGSNHTYQIKAGNSLGETQDALSGSVTTHYLATPIVQLKNVRYDGFSLKWDQVEGASQYTIYVDGSSIGDTSLTSYDVTHDKDGNHIKENTVYTIQVVAENGVNTSEYSEELFVKTLPLQPEVITDFFSFGLNREICLFWSKSDVPEDAFGDPLYDIVGYDIEVDGVVLEYNEDEIHTQQYFIHDGLSPFTSHQYRVRARRDIVVGEWSEYITVSTLPGIPDAPENIVVNTSGQVSELSWENNNGATGYEIYKVSTDETFFVNDPVFVDRGVKHGQENLYQIRVINPVGVSDWSGCIVNNTLQVQSQKGQELDYNTTGSNILDFSPFTLNVYYNPEVLQVKDLCGTTSAYELEAGYIEEAGIEIQNFEPGKITFTVDKEIEIGTMWEGIINNIVFEGQVSGGTTIDYTVYIDKSFEIAGMKGE